MKLHKSLEDQLALVKIYPGINRSLLEHIILKEGLKGILLETYGSGNAPTEEWFVEILRSAISRGVVVVNVTQCKGGSVSMGQYETSSQLKRIGVVSGKDITTEAAIAKMMYLLAKNLSPKVFKTIFETSLRGEML